jgi:hypothetical protein
VWGRCARPTGTGESLDLELCRCHFDFLSVSEEFGADARNPRRGLIRDDRFQQQRSCFGLSDCLACHRRLKISLLPTNREKQCQTFARNSVYAYTAATGTNPSPVWSWQFAG